MRNIDALFPLNATTSFPRFLRSSSEFFGVRFGTFRRPLVKSVRMPGEGRVGTWLVMMAVSLAAGPLCYDVAAPLLSRNGRPFIAAFELKADRRTDFVWPHPTFAAAGYTRVVLVVDEMPRVRPKGSSGPWAALSAVEHLRINHGRPRKRETIDGKSAIRPHADPRETFVVELDAGRLRLSLLLPDEVEIDAQRQSARITLYEADGDAPEPAWGGSPTHKS
jgi:hypothetical protein